jgi:hypothetical protein
MQYVSPEIHDLGSLEELTAGQADGNFLDRDFSVNTPRDDLTFS